MVSSPHQRAMVWMEVGRGKSEAARTFSATRTQPSLVSIARTVPAREMASMAYSTAEARAGHESAGQVLHS